MFAALDNVVLVVVVGDWLDRRMPVANVVVYADLVVE